MAVDVEIVPVKGLAKFLAFCRLPREIYKGMKGFSPPLDLERWTNFAGKLNPHYKLVESQAWLARRDGRYVGRIAAQVYKDGIKPVDTSPGQFGALDAIDDEAVVGPRMGPAAPWGGARGAPPLDRLVAEPAAAVSTVIISARRRFVWASAIDACSPRSVVPIVCGRTP